MWGWSDLESELECEMHDMAKNNTNWRRVEREKGDGHRRQVINNKKQQLAGTERFFACPGLYCVHKNMYFI